MKKVILFLSLLCIIVAQSCTKQNLSEKIVSVVFNLDGFDTGSFPTKGMAEVIAATLPTSLDLTVTNTTTGQSYSTVTGEPINIPVGTYQVTACNEPASVQDIAGIALFLSHTPRVRIDTEVEVVSGVGSYSLTATYESVALAVLTSETSNWAGATSNQVGFTVDAIESGIYKWVFLTGDIKTRKFITTLTPVDGSANRNFTIVGNRESLINFSDGLFVQAGHWYILHPSDIPYQSGGFSVNFPEWLAGE